MDDLECQFLIEMYNMSKKNTETIDILLGCFDKNILQNIYIILIMSFCDLGEVFIAFLALGPLRCLNKISSV